MRCWAKETGKAYVSTETKGVIVAGDKGVIGENIAQWSVYGMQASNLFTHPSMNACNAHSRWRLLCSRESRWKK
jgi:hypothetical protein